MPKLCPSCGRLESGSVQFAGSFCINCFSSRREFFSLPKEIVLRRCARCGNAFLDKKWGAFSERKLAELVERKAKFNFPHSSFACAFTPARNALLARIRMGFEIEGAQVSKDATLHIPLDRNLCDNCRKRSGGYFEAVIQLRGKDRERLRKMAKKLVEKLEKDSFVSAMDEKKEGIDLTVGDRRLAIKAIADLEKPFTQSNKLAGVRDGKRIYRTNICVRL
ncbi:hypothetical protein HY995_01020 [Candidatus Micrarchaeota archaeon]|nr:hypothetical protein [Candidatus Micrarchaeota archaeon]MBI5176649.1 hypothetical protein [Candidatus Micrarchaeota archaeon]